MNTKENIVLITIDSLRTDYCGFMAGDGGNTPAMDRLAENGTVFENAIAPGPATLDSMPVIFSGEYFPRPNPDTSVVDNQGLISNHMRARTSIPERLSNRGYDTAAFTTNPWTSEQFGFHEGFDYFEDFMDNDRSTNFIEGLLHRIGIEDGGPALGLIDQLINWRRQTNMFQQWEAFYDDVLDWREQATEPYFLWLFLVDAHMPFIPPATFRTQSILTTYAANLWLYSETRLLERQFGDLLRRSYADSVAYSDECVGTLMTDLADDEPTFVVHGDHGEAFGENGVYGHGPLLSEELVHTPLVVGNGRGERIEDPFSLADMPALIERLADSRDITSLTQPVVQTRNQDPKIAARGRTWKYIATGETERIVHLYEKNGTSEIDSALKELGRDIITDWREDESERRAITKATREVTARETL